MPASHRRRGTYTPLLLTLSFGLNLFLIGWGITQGLSKPDGTKPDPAPEVVAETIARALPSADGNLLRQAMGDKRQDLQEARRNYLAAFEHLRDVIVTEPLDTDVLHDAVNQMRATRQTERVLFGDTIIDTLPRMSPQGRKAFVVTHMGGRP